MDRERLLAELDRLAGAAADRALDAADADRALAAEKCREALRAGAEVTLAPTPVPTAELRTIYRSRAEHLGELEGSPEGAEAADRLDSTTHSSLVVGRVESGDGTFFQVFLDPALEEVVACLEVASRPPQTGTSAQ